MKKVAQILASIWQLEVSSRFEPMGPKNFFPMGGPPTTLEPPEVGSWRFGAPQVGGSGAGPLVRLICRKGRWSPPPTLHLTAQEL